MNETITLPRLAALMASSLPCNHDEAEKFIRAFFVHIEDALVVSEEIEIDGLGLFRRSDDPENPVIFQASDLIKKALNQPFEMFEAVAVGNADLSQTDENPAPETVPSTPKDEEDLPAEATNTTIEPTVPSEDSEESSPTVCPTPTPIAAVEPVIQIEEEYQSPTVEEHKHRHTALWILAAFVAGLIIGGAMTYYGYEKIVALTADKEIQEINGDVVSEEVTLKEQTTPLTNEVDSTLRTDDTASTDTLPPIVKQPTTVKEDVFDTVTPQRFLTTMARQYYGQMEFWVFIYEANADVLGNPNRIKPGTRVRIPDRSEFSKAESPAELIARAKQMSKDIYSRY